MRVLPGTIAFDYADVPDDARRDAAAAADRIRGRMTRAATDIIEIGRLPIQCQELVGDGNRLPWLEREFGWSESTALRYMHIHKVAVSWLGPGDLRPRGRA